MPQHHARAAGQIALAALLWSSCLPVVSASTCDMSNLTTSCGISEPALIGILVGIVFLICLSGALLGRRRRQRLAQQRLTRLSHIPNNRVIGRPQNLPKPYSAPVSGAYPAYYQATPPAPPPAPTPQYPPRGYNAYHSRSQSSAIRTMPGPTTPVSPTSIYAPSSTISRPISSYDIASHPSRSPARRDDPATIVSPTPSAPAPTSPRSTHRSVAESAHPASLTPRSLAVAIPPAPASSPHPSGTTQPSSNAARPVELAAMPTGTSNTVDEPPPAYTPI